MDLTPRLGTSAPTRKCCFNISAYKIRDQSQTETFYYMKLTILLYFYCWYFKNILHRTRVLFLECRTAIVIFTLLYWYLRSAISTCVMQIKCNWILRSPSGHDTWRAAECSDERRADRRPTVTRQAGRRLCGWDEILYIVRHIIYTSSWLSRAQTSFSVRSSQLYYQFASLKSVQHMTPFVVRALIQIRRNFPKML